MDGSDAAIHLAGSYRVGITAAERPQMYEANVAVAGRVLDAAIVAGISQMVDISTVNVFGNTHGRIVDETYVRDLDEGFLSHYDETKYKAHVAVEARISAGAPIVIILLGMVYGQGDHSAIGAQLKAAYDGTARYIAFGNMGISPTHVDDVATGIVEALDRGRLGEAYLLIGGNLRLDEAMGVAARAAGRRLPRVRIPTAMLRLGSRIAPEAGGLFGLPPNLKEIVSASDGVTYWASHAKATAELGYAPRLCAPSVEPRGRRRVRRWLKAPGARAAERRGSEHDLVVYFGNGSRAPDVPGTRRRARPAPARAPDDRHGRRPRRRTGRRRLDRAAPAP